jgi:hypothetical protein
MVGSRVARTAGAAAVLLLVLLAAIAPSSTAGAEPELPTSAGPATGFSYAGTWSTPYTFTLCPPDDPSQCSPFESGEAAQFVLTGPCDGVAPCQLLVSHTTFPFGTLVCLTPRDDAVGYQFSISSYATSMKIALGGTEAAPTITGSSTHPVNYGGMFWAQLTQYTGATRTAPGSTVTPAACEPVPPKEPAKPATPTAVGGNAKATVSWAAPTGGPEIVVYWVTPYKDGVAQPRVAAFGSGVTSKEVTGLTNGSTYRFTVTAANFDGESPPSELSNAVIPEGPATAPNPPLAVRGIPGPGRVTVEWLPPNLDGGSPVTGYVIETFLDGESTGTTPVGNVGSKVLTGLTSGRWYTFKVAAVNAVGTSAQSAASESVSPTAPTGPKPVADFDGDGTTDVAVFRPSNGGWFVDGSAVTYLGLSGDRPVPADYDGSGSSDRAVWRPSTGAWFTDGAGDPTYHGLDGDIPVPGDYDGDDATDRAVFRPSDGGWYLDGDGVTFLGLATDIPVPADYDGDGTTDLAVFRPSPGAWYVDGEAAQYFGAPGDVPLPGDYDGDGATDLAVFRPSQGAWYVDGGDTTWFGLGTDTPVPGQYDADPATDIAVFRPSNGGWYIDGSPATYYGLDGDIPAPKNPALS